MKRSRITIKNRKAFHGFLFILPWAIGALFFFLIPLFKTIIYSFGEVVFDASGYSFSFHGVANYHFMLFKDVKYLPYLWNALTELVTKVPIILVFSFFVALLLKQKFIGNKIFKAIFFLPVIMSSGAFLAMQGSMSSVNSSVEHSMTQATQAMNLLSSANLELYLGQMGISQKLISYITGPIDGIYSVITVSGIQIFIFLAGLNAISPSLYESCYIEGGGKWETFWKITFPMMMPMILVNVVYSIVNTFVSESNKVMQYAYEFAFKSFKFGLSSSMILLYLLVVSIIMGLVAWIISRRIFYYT